MHKWAVVACDQYTSEPEYWKSVEEYVGKAPSTLNLIFPEVYLEDDDYEERIRKIDEQMQEYLDKGILQEHEPAFFLVERSTPDSPRRWGLMAALDLEKYDYSKGSKTPIRATEGTIEERIPPRKKIREKAPIELPHIMVLIDDEKRSVIEPLAKKAGSFEKVYDFELMKSGGHITGYKVGDAESLEQITSALETLADPKRFSEKHGNEDVLLFAMGDGNHSLATAKAVWEDIKRDRGTSEEVMRHPARWALVEIENIYDDGLIFEPIHRVVFGGDFDAFSSELAKISEIDFKELGSVQEVDEMVRNETGKSELQYIGYLDAKRKGVFEIKKPESTIAAGTAQQVIDTLVKNGENTSVDYIHGEESTETIGSREGNFGLILPPMDKQDFFRTVINDGALPRKTFSMGEAHEKRYYVEARKIVP
jgi:uncharacterized protein (DUF1015 family)